MMPHESGGDRQAQLLDAYADAGLLWAKVVGSSLALAGALIDRGEWEEVRALAGLLADAGEESAATELRIQLGAAVWEAHREQLRHQQHHATGSNQASHQCAAGGTARGTRGIPGPEHGG